MPSSTIALRGEGWPVVELLTAAGVTASKGEATRLIRGGGIYVNGRRVTDEKERLTPGAGDRGPDFVVRKGKKDNFLIRLVA